MTLQKNNENANPKDSPPSYDEVMDGAIGGAHSSKNHVQNSRNAARGENIQREEKKRSHSPRNDNIKDGIRSSSPGVHGSNRGGANSRGGVRGRGGAGDTYRGRGGVNSRGGGQHQVRDAVTVVTGWIGTTIQTHKDMLSCVRSHRMKCVGIDL